MLKKIWILETFILSLCHKQNNNKNMKAIHISSIAENIRKSVKEKGVSPMLIEAYNKVNNDNHIYNLYYSISLADAVLKGLTANKIHHLVNCFEFGGFNSNEKVDYTCWFVFCRGMLPELLTKEALCKMIDDCADEIAYELLKNPFEFKDLYISYVTPMVVLQEDID